jgi:hypothetical protein
MTMIKVKKILADDIFGLWHVKEIIVNKDGKRFSFAPDNETFPTKEEAEQHAHYRARHFIQRKLGLGLVDGMGTSNNSVTWKGETVRSLIAKAMKLLHRVRSIGS